MFKSFLEWLIRDQPLPNWVILLMLLGFLCGMLAVFLALRGEEL